MCMLLGLQFSCQLSQFGITPHESARGKMRSLGGCMAAGMDFGGYALSKHKYHHRQYLLPWVGSHGSRLSRDPLWIQGERGVSVKGVCVSPPCPPFGAPPTQMSIHHSCVGGPSHGINQHSITCCLRTHSLHPPCTPTPQQKALRVPLCSPSPPSQALLPMQSRTRLGFGCLIALSCAARRREEGCLTALSSRCPLAPVVAVQ